MCVTLNQYKSSTTGATCRARLATLPEHQTASPICNGVFASQSFVFCVVFCRSLFSDFWAFHCLSFDLELRNTPLVSKYDYKTKCNLHGRNKSTEG